MNQKAFIILVIISIVCIAYLTLMVWETIKFLELIAPTEPRYQYACYGAKLILMLTLVLLITVQVIVLLALYVEYVRR